MNTEWTSACVTDCPACGGHARWPLLLTGEYGTPDMPLYIAPSSRTAWTLFWMHGCGHMWSDDYLEWEQLRARQERTPA